MLSLLDKITQDPNQLLYCQLSHLGSLTIQGKDAFKFLQNLLTCDMREVTHQQMRWGAFCNNKGRILSHVFSFKIAESYLLLLPQENITAILAVLDKYAVFSQVTIYNSSQDWHTIGLIDKLENPILAQQTNSKLLTKYQLTTLEHLCLALIRTKPWCYLGLLPSSKQIEQLPLNLKQIDSLWWKFLEFQAGFAAIYPETSNSFLAHELNYPLLGGVSFSKGCYLGQEIIARLEYRGKTKRHLAMRWLSATKPPKRGDLFYDTNNHEIGSLIDMTSISSGQYAILILLNEQDMDRSSIPLAIPKHALLSSELSL